LTRDKPSTKARERSYEALRKLFNVLDKLMISHPWFRGEDEEIEVDYKGWKEWVNKHTPPNKRGGLR
jgi:hypothetical protein